MDGGRRVVRSLTQAIGRVFNPGAAARPTFAASRSQAPAPRILLRGERSAREMGWSLRLDRPAPRGTGSALALMVMLGVGAIGAVAGGHYQAFVEREGGIGDFLARAIGFDIATVTISGQVEMREPEILADAGISPRNSLLFLDVAQARARLEAIPLIKQASVRKLYPDRIIINLVERTPSALWQKDGQVRTISADGAIIDDMRDQRFAALPFVVGEGANDRLSEFTALLNASEELRPKIRAGVLIGERRWNLKMTSGVDVKLPELNALGAMAMLLKLQRQSRILDKDVLSLDLRVEGKAFARLSEDAAAARAEAHARKGAT
jgi:cell division protein FtsQ